MNCIWGIEGCNCWAGDDNGGEFQGIFAGLTVLPYGGEFTLADLGLDVQTMPLEVEDDTLARVIAEVRAGSILMPEEGEALLEALVNEELAHAETLADLSEAEDEVAELTEQNERQAALLELANFGLELGLGAIAGAKARNAMLTIENDLLIDIIDEQNEEIALLRAMLREAVSGPSITVLALI